MENKNIYQRMLNIQTELGTVAKNITIQATKTSGYKAVSERDVIDAVKPLEAKYGVYSFPFNRSMVATETLESERLFNGEATKITSKFIRLEVTYRFVNVDDPSEYVDITSYGDGIDTGDKAVGKAMTYADKYALMKAYKISTGDDPDQEKSSDEGYKVVDRKKATDKQIAYIKRNDQRVVDEVLSRYNYRMETLTVEEASKVIEVLRNGN